MACAKCSFYVPKELSRTQITEATSKLQWMMQEIPLRKEEGAAVEDRIEVMENGCARLVDIPIPSGSTPHDIIVSQRRKLPLLQVSGNE
jgi:hypothetical protein